jgi:phosphoserine phosphatase RsbU/P
MQPSPHFDHADLDLWRDIIKLADILTVEFSLQSLLIYLDQLFSHEYHAKFSLWLISDTFDSSIDLSTINGDVLRGELSPLMDAALKNKRPKFTHILLGSDGVDTPNIIAIPLLMREEELGVIELEAYPDSTFTAIEIMSVITIVSLFSIGLHHLKRSTHRQFLQICLDERIAVEGISKSILSNLDRESLFNNLLSQMDQQYKHAQVNLYLFRSNERNRIKQIGITSSGIYPEMDYYLMQDNGPVSWAILNKMPVICNRGEYIPDISAQVTISDRAATCVIPLLIGPELIGAIEICSNSIDVFGPEMIAGLHSLGQNISLAIRNANIYRSEIMKINISDRLQEAIGLISAELSVNDVLQILMDELEDIFVWDSASIWLFENSNDDAEIAQYTSDLRLAAYRIRDGIKKRDQQTPSGNNNERLNHSVEITLGEGEITSLYPWLSTIITSRTPKIRNKGDSYEPLGELLGYNKDYSAIGASFSNNGIPGGILLLTHSLSNLYDDDTKLGISSFVKYATIAIANSKLYTAAHDQAWVSTVLLQVAEATQSITNLKELLDTVTGMLPSLLSVQACTIFLWDSSIEGFIPSATFGLNEEQTARINALVVFPGDIQAFDDLISSSQPVIINSDSAPEEIVTQVFTDYDLQNDLLILFPLVSQNHLCGALLIDFSNSSLEKDSPQEIWDEKYTLVEGIARQAATAIENLQLIKAQEEEAYTSIALLQVAQAIVSFNQLDEILSSIVRITPILVGVKRCIMYLWDSKDRIFRLSQHFGFSKSDLALLGEVIKANEFPFIETIQKEKQILFHPLDADDSPHDWLDFPLDNFYKVESKISDTDEEISIKLDSKWLIKRERLLFGFPLAVKDEILGVMLIEEEDSSKGVPAVHIREKRIEIVNGITQQAAIAIKNELLQQEAVKSERMERELQLAREIQATFLPDNIPVISGWEIDARWQPARQVAGDFYDIIRLNDDQIGFVIADVADKGMPAALFMILIRTLIRSAAKEELSPASVLRQVNELLIPDSKHGMFVTVFYAVFSISSGKFVYANAGHNPPVLKQFSQENLVELSRTTIALGIFEGIEVDERELILSPGDLVFFYTDGITEAFSSQDEMYGKDRLFNLLSGDNLSSSKELLDKVEDAVSKFIEGTDLSDDMTLAVIRRLPNF